MATTPDQDARFVFSGTVKSVARGGEKTAEVTAEVTVQNVLRAPQTLADSAGNTVIVKLQPGEQFATGDQATFYANPVRWGEMVTVQSTGHIPAAAPPVAVKSHGELQLEEQVAKADVVVSGKVTAVQLPGEGGTAKSMRRSAAATPVEPKRISEHDPMWREAVIDVRDTHKGRTGGKIVVRFPKSNDVRWRSAPKFQTGQEGVFLLHQDHVAPTAAAATSVAKRAAAAPPAPAASYVALSSADFQPSEREEAIKSMIRGGRQ
jgi:hypothetical protein